MHTIGQTLPTSETDAAVERERWQVFQEVVVLHDRLGSAASRDLLDYARRSWEAAFTGERPTLHLVGCDEP